MQVKKQQLEMDMEQQSVVPLDMEQQTIQIWKGLCQGYLLSPCLFNYMQNISCEMLGWKKHNLESRLSGEISITSDMQMTVSLWQKAKKN